MRGFRVLWAGALGYMLDAWLLTPLVVGISWLMAGIEQYVDLSFTNPIHILVGLVLPVLMTVIGGGVAGAMAPDDAREAGALVGGFGLLSMAIADLGGYAPHALTMIISQGVATALAAVAAIAGANYRRRLAQGGNTDG